MEKASKETIKYINKQHILNLFTAAEELTRADAVERTGLSAATVSALTTELADDGWIFEKRIGASTGGRKPVFYSLNREHLYVLSLWLTPFRATLGFSDLSGNIFHQQTLKVLVDGEEAFERVLQAVIEKAAAAGYDMIERIHTVAIACPAIVDAASGRIVYSSLLHLKDLDVEALVRRNGREEWNVCLFNDTDALLLGEALLPETRERSTAYLLCENGIGLSCLMHGELLRMSGCALELGHITMNLRRGEGGQYSPEGPYVGACLAEKAAIARYRALSKGSRPDPEGYEDLFFRRLAGDQEAGRVVAEMTDLLAWVAANTVDILGPEVLIIGGAFSAMGEELAGQVCEKVRSRAIPVFGTRVEIRCASLGVNAALLGMSNHVLRTQLFRDINL